MKRTRSLQVHIIILSILGTAWMAGCQSRYEQARLEGLQLKNDGRYSAAAAVFQSANDMIPENVDNLCDIAECFMGTATDYKTKGNIPAAMREAKMAIIYYNRAITSFPGSQRALTGKTEALKMKGLYDEALETAEWASKNVGPSSTQQLFLAKELAARGDADKALLTFRQAIAMDPKNPDAHRELGFFLIKLERNDEGIEQLQESYRLNFNQPKVADELRRLHAEVPQPPAKEPGK